MLTFLKKITHTISTHNLIKRGDTVVLGVSGGADSMALLEVFDKIRHAWGLQVIVCHVNHGLRKSADADERFVKKICDQRGIPCHCVRITMPAKPKDSIEQLAREKRFAALIKTAKKLNADAVALAHHQNDLAETVLMRIIRGSGLQGLQAILPKRRINGTLFIRPLIHQTREDIEKFLTQQGVSYRNDPTNSDLKFFRNKIRHQLMNCLRTKYNPKIQEALAGLAETASIDYGFLQQEAEKNFKTVVSRKSSAAVSLNLKQLTTKHPAIQRMIIRMAIEHIKGSTRAITLTHIRAIETFLNDDPPIGAKIHLPLKITVEKNKTRLSMTLRH